MMTDQEALLQTILDRPDEDTPRLVYADWLEEHGEELYAEFIRLQCALDSLPCYGVKPDLRFARMERVFGELRRKWWCDFYQIPVRSSDFRRGFLVKPIQLEEETFADSIFWWSNVTWMRVSLWLCGPIFQRATVLVTGMKNILELGFRTFEVGDRGEPERQRGMIRLFESDKLSNLSNLQILDFSDFLFTPEIVTAVCSCRYLNQLHELRVTLWHRQSAEMIAPLRKRFGNICRVRTWNPSLQTYTFE